MTSTAPEPELLTIAEVAPLLRSSVRSIQRAIHDGTFPLPVVRPSPGRQLVSRVMLQRYIETGVPIRAAS